MSAGMMFVFMLIIGMILTFSGKKSSDISKVIIMVVGVIMVLIAVFGIFTSLI